jgi:hypothetical protein
MRISKYGMNENMINKNMMNKIGKFNLIQSYYQTRYQTCYKAQNDINKIIR